MTRLSPSEFIETLYLGDRACKSIRIDGWTDRLTITVDEISRIRSKSGEWEFYNDENILDGEIVFSGVTSVAFDPSGPIPTELITGISASANTDDASDSWTFVAEIGARTATGDHIEVKVTIVGRDVHLEDPSRPGVMIRE